MVAAMAIKEPNRLRIERLAARFNARRGRVEATTAERAAAFEGAFVRAREQILVPSLHELGAELRKVGHDYDVEIDVDTARSPRNLAFRVRLDGAKPANENVIGFFVQHEGSGNKSEVIAYLALMNEFDLGRFQDISEMTRDALEQMLVDGLEHFRWSATRAESVQKLVKGIHAFQKGYFASHRELFEQLSSAGQKPETLFITCSDSRVVPSLITNAAPGELFEVRNVGNVVPHPTLPGGTAAALEFAVAVLGVEDIIVCGHTQCGAIQAILEPERMQELSFVKQWLTQADAVRRIIGESVPPPGGRGALDGRRRGERARAAREPARISVRLRAPGPRDAAAERLGLSPGEGRGLRLRPRVRRVRALGLGLIFPQPSSTPPRRRKNRSRRSKMTCASAAGSRSTAESCSWAV